MHEPTKYSPTEEKVTVVYYEAFPATLLRICRLLYLPIEVAYLTTFHEGLGLRTLSLHFYEDVGDGPRLDPLAHY